MPTTTPARFTITLGERLNREFDEVIGMDEETKAAAIRKAIHLYIAARRAANNGAKVGIAEPGQRLATEFINL